MNKYTPAKQLRAGFIDAKPIDFDFSEGWAGEDGWEYFEATECHECEKSIVTSGYTECRNCGAEIYADGPLMNFMYPIGDVDTEIYMPNLCIVEYDGDNYLALTAGGSDYSWDICYAYMIQGYLPPIHFARLSNMAGMTYSKKIAWIIAGVGMSLSIMERQISHAESDLKNLIKELKSRD